ncbi:hypothetical protein [Prosthecobacter sp.]|uniref:hypothetical protein n=1 Tax=Prosthecobacter sp. TaxID=1965333 RepID=UPI003783B056
MISVPSTSVLACATCMADKGSLVGQAQGFAILFMLGILAFMFICAAAFIISFIRRQNSASAAAAANLI